VADGDGDKAFDADDEAACPPGPVSPSRASVRWQLRD
jgi:hypothetical protein